MMTQHSIYAPVKIVIIISSGNGLLPARRQAINRTSADETLPNSNPNCFMSYKEHGKM